MEFVDEILSILVKAGHFAEFVANSPAEKEEFYIEYKQDLSPVTFADLGVQVIITEWLIKKFGKFSLIAEETLEDAFTHWRKVSSIVSFLNRFGVEVDILDMPKMFIVNKVQPDHSEGYWVLDPIDGTKGFLRGGQYAISLAYVEGDMVKVGFLICPRLELPELFEDNTKGVIFFAEAGKGAWVAPMDDMQRKKRIRVSCRNEFEESVLLSSYESSHTDREKSEKFKECLGITKEMQVDSQVKYGLLACGLGDLILRFPPKEHPDYKEKIWDHAGGTIILEEAGGKVTDLYGNRFGFKPDTYFSQNVGVFASNGILHSRGLDVLKEILGG